MKKFVFRRDLLKRYVPYELDNGDYGVLDRQTGELMLHPDGRHVSLPVQWANHQCTKLENER